jgi:hypothetical protein
MVSLLEDHLATQANSHALHLAKLDSVKPSDDCRNARQTEQTQPLRDEAREAAIARAEAAIQAAEARSDTTAAQHLESLRALLIARRRAA